MVLDHGLEGRAGVHALPIWVNVPDIAGQGHQEEQKETWIESARDLVLEEPRKPNAPGGERDPRASRWTAVASTHAQPSCSNQLEQRETAVAQESRGKSPVPRGRRPVGLGRLHSVRVETPATVSLEPNWKLGLKPPRSQRRFWFRTRELVQRPGWIVASSRGMNTPVRV